MKKTKEQKKSDIRNLILDACDIYRKNLVGKVFLFVYGEQWFEVVFQADRFMHLTGVESQLSALNFYKKARSRKLTEKQFFFTSKHPYESAKNKLPCLLRLPELTTELTCVVRDFKTVTLTYKIGLTNLDFTLGLAENLDIRGNKINDWFIPRTLRAKDKAIENSNDAQFIDFVFEKNALTRKYANMTFGQKDKMIPACIHGFLDSALLEHQVEQVAVS